LMASMMASDRLSDAAARTSSHPSRSSNNKASARMWAQSIQAAAGYRLSRSSHRLSRSAAPRSTRIAAQRSTCARPAKPDANRDQGRTPDQVPGKRRRHERKTCRHQQVTAQPCQKGQSRPQHSGLRCPNQANRRISETPMMDRPSPGTLIAGSVMNPVPPDRLCDIPHPRPGRGATIPADQTSSGEMAHPLRGGVAKPRVSCSRTTAGLPNQL
jgi:hypothetical protein